MISILQSIPLWTVWLTAAVVLAIAEMFSTTGVALCLSLAALGSMFAALCDASAQTQLLVFAVAAVLALLFIAPVARRMLHKAAPHGAAGASNMDALNGRVVTLDNDLEPGMTTRVRIDGDNWQVRAADPNVTLKAGKPHRVCGHDSIILLIK